MPEQVMQQIGRIRKVVPQNSYGFILTDAEEEFFFHQSNTRDKKLPRVGTVVRFQAVRQAVAGKKDPCTEFARNDGPRRSSYDFTASWISELHPRGHRYMGADHGHQRGQFD